MYISIKRNLNIILHHTFKGVYILLFLFYTELSVKEVDVEKKEDKVTELLTLFFSHPDVEGVLFWGFWDGKIFESDAALFNGDNVTV